MPPTAQEKAPPEELVKYEAGLARRRAAKKAGRLFRVQHASLGHSLTEAKDASEAVAQFAREHRPSEARDKEWLDRFAAECRVGQVR